MFFCCLSFHSLELFYCLSLLSGAAMVLPRQTWKNMHIFHALVFSGPFISKTSLQPSLPSHLLSLPRPACFCKRGRHIDLFFLSSAFHNSPLKSFQWLTVLVTLLCCVVLYRCVGVFVCLHTVRVCVCVFVCVHVCKSKDTTDM